MNTNPDGKVHGANMGPTWVLSAPDGPHGGTMNLAIREMYRVWWYKSLHCGVAVHIWCALADMEINHITMRRHICYSSQIRYRDSIS